MSDQKKLSTYFRSKRVSAQSPLKKKSRKTKKSFTQKLLTLKDLFTKIKPQNKEPCEFLSTVKEKSLTNLNHVSDEPKENSEPQLPIIVNNGEDILKTPLLEQNVDRLENSEICKSPRKQLAKCSHDIFRSRKRLFYDEETKNLEPMKKKPAYKRFRPLCQVVPDSFDQTARDIHLSTTIYLPLKYQQLYDIYIAMETVLHVFEKRNEACEFSRLKSSVESMSKLNLAQIIHLVPNYFRVYLTDVSNDSCSNEKLIIETQNNEGKTALERRKHFHSLLIDEIMSHHQNYLTSFGVTIEKSDIKRFHPRFLVEEVPDIHCAVLPEPQEKKVYSAKEMLTLTCYNDDEKMLKALNEASKDLYQPENVDIQSDLLKIVPKSFLERIQAKEKLNAQKLMLKDSSRELLITRMQRLPTIMRSIHSCFVAEKKPYLPKTLICEKLKDSCLPDQSNGKIILNLDNIELHLLLLENHIFDWYKTVNINNVQYVNLNLNLYDINTAILKIEDITKSL